MSAASLVTVNWTPETSGRVSAVQIDSRIKGQASWTSQGSSIDPTAGTARFISDAPGAVLEVRIRYRMTSGVFGPYVTQETATFDVSTSDTTARNAASNALQQLANIIADNILSQDEKPTFRMLFAQAGSEYQNARAAGDKRGLDLSSLDATWNQLSSYVGFLNLNGSGDVTIDRNQLNSSFANFWSSVVALWAAIDAQALFNEKKLLASVADMASDGILTTGEKPEINRSYGEMQKQYTGLAAAADQRGIAYPEYQNAMGSLTAVAGKYSFGNATQEERDVNPSEIYNAFLGCAEQAAKTRLSIDSDAYTKQQNSLDRLKGLADDNILAKEEKFRAVLEWQNVNSLILPYDNAYANIGSPSAVQAARNEAVDALNQLATFLGSLSPAWTDSTKDTAINGGEYLRLFQLVYAKGNAFAARLGTYTPPSGGGGTTTPPPPTSNVIFQRTVDELCYGSGSQPINENVNWANQPTRFTLTPQTLYGANNNTAAAQVVIEVYINYGYIGGGYFSFNSAGQADSGPIIFTNTPYAGSQNLLVYMKVSSGADGPIRFNVLAEKV